jgi:hypothetical protein
MKSLLETISTILFFVFCLALMFVFHGEPNVWDKWHQAAMGVCKS